MNVKTIVEGTNRDMVIKTYVNDVLISSLELVSDEMMVFRQMPTTKNLTCENCKYWNIGLGSCGRVNTIWNMDRAVTGFDTVVECGDDPYISVYLNTDPEFYCCKWEAK